MDIHNAKQSPRIEREILYWYKGDTFELVLTLVLTDVDGTVVNITSTDSVAVIFYNDKSRIIKTFTITDILNNVVKLNFDSTCTALFDHGKYTYTIILNHEGKITTLVHENNCIVE